MTDTASRPRRQAERREATRRELLRLGMERFPVKGYAATTIDDLVSGTDISRPTWYFHFGDKEDYFLEIMRRRIELRGEWWLIARDESLATLEEILGAVFGHFDDVHDDSSKWVMLIADHWQAARSRPEHVETLRRMYAGYIGEIARFVGGLRTRGMVASRSDDTLLATRILAMIEGSSLHAAIYANNRFDRVGAVQAVLAAD